MSRPALVILLLLFLPGTLRSQTATTQERDNSASTTNNGTVAPSGDKKQKKHGSEGQQTKRMFYIVPNFAAVSANTQLPPLSAGGKFDLALHDSIDYSFRQQSSSRLDATGLGATIGESRSKVHSRAAQRGTALSLGTESPS